MSSPSIQGGKVLSSREVRIITVVIVMVTLAGKIYRIITITYYHFICYLLPNRCPMIFPVLGSTENYATNKTRKGSSIPASRINSYIFQYISMRPGLVDKRHSV